MPNAHIMFDDFDVAFDSIFKQNKPGGFCSQENALHALYPLQAFLVTTSAKCGLTKQFHKSLL